MIVEDGGYARIYDWGIFSFPGDNFIKAFALNAIKYRCGVSPAQWDIDAYIEEDRDIVIYTLDLEAEKKEAVLRYADNNVLPENCWYIYHQFRDNCSTRIRDLIDLGTGGQFKGYFKESPGRFTFREHMRRFTWYSPFFDWFFSFLLGRDIDRKISKWEEMFLPVELGQNITGFSYLDASGVKHELVGNVEIIHKTEMRKAVLDAPKSQLPLILLPGLALAAFPAFFCLFRKKHPLAGRILWGICNSIFGLAFGLAGTVLFFASRIAERDYMRHNINLLFINPLLLVAIPLGVLAASGKSKAEIGLRILWAYVFFAGLVSALINIVPGFYQNNWSSLALILPVTLALIVPKIRCKFIIKDNSY